MRPVLTPDEMAAADQATIDGGTPISTLMDRAGRAVARAAIRLAGGRYGKRVAIVCGKGNNGGDGFAAARVLRREGMGVVCLTLADQSEFRGAAAEHLENARRAGVRIEAFEPSRLRGCEVVIDAMFGTGFRGPAEGSAAGAIEAVNGSGAPVVAVDIPSGVNGASGGVDGPAVRANVTVVMAAEKLGTAIHPGAANAGLVEVADIAITIEDARVWMIESEDVTRAIPSRPPDTHKRSVGSVAVLAGSEGMSGAALLCARGAGRMGAGYVTLGTTRSVEAAKAAVLPEVLSVVVEESHVLGPGALKTFGPVLERADALAIGPGLGQGEEQTSLVAEALAGVDLPIVLDADGLNVLAQDVGPLRRRSHDTVITPHPGEMARLLDVPTKDILADRVGSACRAAADFGCVVLLKGSRTVIADPAGTAAINPTGGPELATAGSGDVLTGAVAALLAAGTSPFEAAWAAAYVHGLAGKIAAQDAGRTGVVAWDVAEALGEAVELVRGTGTLSG
ncbi:MAG: NAD(P)H-hydrate dehydratase [Actinomycetota bacterium]